MHDLLLFPSADFEWRGTWTTNALGAKKATLPLIRFFARVFVNVAEFVTVSEVSKKRGQVSHTRASPPSFLAYLSPVTMSPQDFRVQGQAKVSHAVARSHAPSRRYHMCSVRDRRPPAAGPLCLGPTME